jgi:hypothetical protein
LADPSILNPKPKPMSPQSGLPATKTGWTPLPDGGPGFWASAEGGGAAARRAAAHPRMGGVQS